MAPPLRLVFRFSFSRLVKVHPRMRSLMLMGITKQNSLFQKRESWWVNIVFRLFPGGGGGGDEAMPDNIEELGESNKPVESSAQANLKRPSFPDSYWGGIMQITVENKANVIDIPLETKK